jgi:polysaccharide biosynthesis/export protein
MTRNSILKIAGVLLLGLVATAYAGQNQRETATAPSGQSASQATAQAPQDPSRPALTHRYPRYKLRRSDQITLDFPLVVEYDQTVTVQPDGYITLKDVGDTFVEGLTVPELVEAVRVKYSKILHDPIVTADLKDYQKPYFTALGEVGKPGKYELREDITVAEAIAIAGGFITANAKHSQVLLFRRVSDQWTEVKDLNMKKMLNSKRSLAEDVHLEPGDLVFVPTNFISKLKPYLPSESVSAFAKTF